MPEEMIDEAFGSLFWMVIGFAGLAFAWIFVEAKIKKALKGNARKKYQRRR